MQTDTMLNASNRCGLDSGEEGPKKSRSILYQATIVGERVGLAPSRRLFTLSSLLDPAG
jgi:hypothetical protein